MSYTIQCTITKLSSDGSVMVKGCEGYCFKKNGIEKNLLLEFDENAAKEETGQFCLKPQDESYKSDEKMLNILSGAVSNNKRVELVLGVDESAENSDGEKETFLKITTVTIIA